MIHFQRVLIWQYIDFAMTFLCILKIYENQFLYFRAKIKYFSSHGWSTAGIFCLKTMKCTLGMVLDMCMQKLKCIFARHFGERECWSCELNGNKILLNNNETLWSFYSYPLIKQQQNRRRGREREEAGPDWRW